MWKHLCKRRLFFSDKPGSIRYKVTTRQGRNNSPVQVGVFAEALELMNHQWYWAGIDLHHYFKYLPSIKNLHLIFYTFIIE